MNRPYKRMMVIFIPLSVIVTLMAVFSQPTYNSDLLKQLWICTVIMTVGCIWGEWVEPKIEMYSQWRDPKKGDPNRFLLGAIGVWSVMWDVLGLVAVFGFGLIGLVVLYLSILTLQ